MVATRLMLSPQMTSLLAVWGLRGGSRWPRRGTVIQLLPSPLASALSRGMVLLLLTETEQRWAPTPLLPREAPRSQGVPLRLEGGPQWLMNPAPDGNDGGASQ